MVEPMQECSDDVFIEKTKSLLLKIIEIRQDTGYSADQVLIAMLVSAIQIATKPISIEDVGGDKCTWEYWDPNFVGSRTIET